MWHLALKMASAQVVEMSVTNNSPSQDSSDPDDLSQQCLQINERFGFKSKCVVSMGK